MTRPLALILLGMAIATVNLPGEARAADFGSAVLNGIWSNAGTWTPGGGPPGAADTAYIGSNTPVGSLATTTVTLSANQAAGNLSLGHSGGGVGTLDLNGNSLSVGSGIQIGQFGATGVIQRTGGGTFSTVNLSVHNTNVLALAAGDVVSGTLLVNAGGQVSTAATGNVAQNAQVFGGGSELTLGAALSLTQDLDLRGTGATAATLDAAGNNIAANNIYLGRFNSSAEILNRGTITATSGLFADRSNFTFAAGDSAAIIGAANGAVVTLDATTAATNLQIFSGGQIITTATSNVTLGATVFDAGSLLTLGADLNLAQTLDIRGTGALPGTVDAAGHDIMAGNIFIGRFNTPGEIINRGAITAFGNLHVDRSNFSFGASDDATTASAANNAVVNLHANTTLTNVQVASGAEMNTVATSNVTQTAQVFDGGSRLTLGADLTLNNELDIRGTGANPGTVDAGGHNITANNIYIGRFNSSGEILNRGTITALGNLHVDRSNFNFGAADDAATASASNNANVQLHANTTLTDVLLNTGAQMTTAATGNLTSGALIADAGTKLTLGAALVLAQDLDIRGTAATPGTVDAGGHNITANNIYLGRFNSAGQIINRGVITANNGLSVDRTNFAFGASDSAKQVQAANGAVVDLHANTAAEGIWALAGGQINTVAAGNVSQSVLVTDANSRVNLGADLTVSGDIDIRGNGAVPAAVDAGGHDVTAANIFIGRFGNEGSLLNDGAVLATAGMLVDNSTPTLHGGNDSVGTLSLITNSTLTIEQANNGLTGFTVNANLLNIENGSTLVLNFDGGFELGFDWVFRWANPLVGDRITAINDFITIGKFAVAGNPQPYSVLNGGDGFTYIGYNAVPEPSSVVLCGLALLALPLAALRRRK